MTCKQQGGRQEATTWLSVQQQTCGECRGSILQVGGVQRLSSCWGMPEDAGRIASPQVNGQWCLDHNTSRPQRSCFWERTSGDGIAPAANYFEAWLGLEGRQAGVQSLQGVCDACSADAVRRAADECLLRQPRETLFFNVALRASETLVR